MTYKEFFDTRSLIFVHCRTLEQAKKFCENATLMGRRWCTGQIYDIEHTNWDTYRSETAYSNRGTYVGMDYVRRNACRCIDFIDLEGIEVCPFCHSIHTMHFCDECYCLDCKAFRVGKNWSKKE